MSEEKANVRVRVAISFLLDTLPLDDLEYIHGQLQGRIDNFKREKNEQVTDR